MIPIEELLDELEQEGATTRRLLEGVPDDLFSWRPHEKGMSTAELCGHLASIAAGMPHVLGGESFDITQRPGPEAPPANGKEAVRRFDEAVLGAREWMQGLGDRATETWTLYRGRDEMMVLPRTRAIRYFLLNHLYHHRGQLSAYLRTAGAKVPSVYGPTADVDPFAE